MSALPTMTLLMAVGYAYGGVLWMAWGAAAGWVCCTIGAYIEERYRVLRDRDTLRHLTALSDCQAATLETLKDLKRVNLAIMDALPVEHSDQLDLHSPRTEAEWDAIEPKRWPLVRRRLVSGFGLSADKVDAAKRYVIDQHYSGNRLPRTDDQLQKMCEAWDQSNRESIETILASHQGRRTASTQA